MTNKQDLSELNILGVFVKEWKECASAKTVLHLKTSTFGVFSKVDGRDFLDVTSPREIPVNSSFDLILGDLPLGMNQIDWDHGGTKLKIQRNWAELLESLSSLNEGGTGLFLLEPLGFSTSRGRGVESDLNRRGFFVSAIFNAPERMLQPETSITPIIAAITTTQVERLFVAELLNEEQAQQVVRSYFSSKDGSDLKSGKYIGTGSYDGFDRIKIKQQIERLETQYKSYEEYTLGDLAVEINYVKAGSELQERENSIYIPKIGNSPVVSKLSDVKLKHHNCFQVVLGKQAINEYVSAFFKSALGRLILGSLTSQTFVAHLNKRDLEQALVALPSPEEQQSIVNTQKKLYSLKFAINEFDKELALNPTSSSSILNQLDLMLDAIGNLTDTDRVRNIIREGETKHIEFKETLSLDAKKNTKEKYIELSVLKTVVAFLNTDGGILLLGVSDEGIIAGLDTEIGMFHKNVDKFLLHWKNLLKTRVGEEFYPYIEYRMIEVEAKLLLLVDCKPSQSPCYLDNSEFYVRTNPATDKLEGPKLVEYIKNHFGY
jgi:hypothetical protein